MQLIQLIIIFLLFPLIASAQVGMNIRLMKPAEGEGYTIYTDGTGRQTYRLFAELLPDSITGGNSKTFQILSISPVIENSDTTGFRMQLSEHGGDFWLLEGENTRIEKSGMSVKIHADADAVQDYINAGSLDNDNLILIGIGNAGATIPVPSNWDKVESDDWTTSDFSSTNVSNWNTAYSWGNHATSGYLTSFTESDPTVLASVKDGVSWSELTEIPSGFLDGVDNNDNWYPTSVAVTGTTTKTITINRNGLSAITASWTDETGSGGSSDGNNYTTGISFSGTTTKTLTVTRAGLGNLTAAFTDIDTKLTQEETQDYIGSMVIGNTESGIQVVYDDANNQFDFVVTESDPTIEAHIKNITTTEKANWNTAFSWGNHANAGYITAAQDQNTTYTAGGGLTLTGTTFSLTDLSSQPSVDNSGNTVIQDVTLDTYGRVTGLTSATLTDDNNYITGASFSGTTTKTLTVTREGLGNLTAAFTDLNDNWYPTSVAVTGTTTKTLTIGRNGLSSLTANWTDETGGTNFTLAGDTGSVGVTEGETVAITTVDAYATTSASGTNPNFVFIDINEDGLRDYILARNYIELNSPFSSVISTQLDNVQELHVSAIVNNGGSNNLFLPTPTSALRGKKIYLNSYTFSGSLNITHTSSPGSYIHHKGVFGAVPVLNSEAVIATCMKYPVGSTSYYWDVMKSN